MTATLSPLALRRQVLAASRARKPSRPAIPPKLPTAIALEYQRRLRALSQAMDEAIFAALTDAGIRMDAADGSAPGEGPSREEINRIIRQITARLKQIAGSRQLLAGVNQLAQRVLVFSRDEWRKQLQRTLGIDLSQDPKLGPLVDRFRKRQGSLITSLADDKVQRVKRVLVENGDARVETIAKRIRESTDATASRAELIARTEISTLHSQVSAARAQAVGITEFRWSTSLDERTRPSHAALEGKVFSYDDPPDIPGEGKHLPGAFPNCRCLAVSLIPNIDA